MTGYHISIGYNSTLNHVERTGKAWEALKETVSQLRTRTNAIVAEVLREQPNLGPVDVLVEYAETYGQDVDRTLTIIEATDDRPAEIMQLASGGGDARDIKEAMRRAFSRLVIFEMHKRGIEVNFHVA